MKILLAADGSEYTAKALNFLTAHKQLLSKDDELLVIHAQMLLPTIFNAAINVEKALEINESAANEVLLPIRKFLEKHAINYRCLSVVGSVAKEIVDAAKSDGVQLILMGTHGRSAVGSALMGSVAQRVVANSTVPVLLVK